jgi:recombination protein RecR
VSKQSRYPDNTRQAPAYPAPVERLLIELTKLPGIGRRSAERLAFHVLKGDKQAATQLARAIVDVKSAIGHCSVCSNLTEHDPCPVCDSDKRDRTKVLVVEQPKDLIAIEQTAMYRGLYHVLLGRISPLDGIGPEHLTAADLFTRVDNPAKNASGVRIEEIILGMNPTVEGDGTALYLMNELKGRDVSITRLARGLPSGWSMELASKAVLADAIEGRQQIR